MEEHTPALRYMEFYDKTDPKVQIRFFFDFFSLALSFNPQLKVDKAATMIQSCFKGRKARMEVRNHGKMKLKRIKSVEQSPFHFLGLGNRIFF